MGDGGVDEGFAVGWAVARCDGGNSTGCTRHTRPERTRSCSPALRKIVSKNEFGALGEEFEKKEHQLFGEDGFEKMVDRVALIEKTLGSTISLNLLRVRK